MPQSPGRLSLIRADLRSRDMRDISHAVGGVGGAVGGLSDLPSVAQADQMENAGNDQSTG